MDDGGTIELELRITNHSARRLGYKASWNLPAGLKLISADKERTIAPRADGVLRARVRGISKGLHVVTADVSFAGYELKQWTEALIRVR
jgi:hypothetical protein